MCLHLVLSLLKMGKAAWQFIIFMSETTESVKYLHIINNDKQSDQKKLSARSPSSFTVWKNKCFNNSLTWHNKPARRKLGLGSNFPVNLALEHGNMGGG